MNRFFDWMFRGWEPKDYATMRVLTIILWAFLIGFLLGHYVI